MSVLVIDVGTSGVRSALVEVDGSITYEARQSTLPDSPMPGLVEFDAEALAAAALTTAVAACEAASSVEAVGIANQRASTIVWDRATGEPVAPALGWQDLRTVGDCLVLAAEGFRFAPNQSATKLSHLLDNHDPDRTRDLCFGTVDTWLAWKLTDGEQHVTDGSNAAVTGFRTGDGLGWSETVLDRLRVPASALPTVVDSTGVVGPATALPGAPPIAGIVGDQQSSLIGQGCVQPGLGKATFGTGGMLDICTGDAAPAFAGRSENGSFPIVAWQADGAPVFGVEGVMLAAGTNVEWLVEDIGLIGSPADSEALAASAGSSDGVVYVPAPLGLGTPHWDFGARGTLLGLTRGTTSAHVARAVLEGVAMRGAELLDAVEADTAMVLSTLRVDGGMSANGVFVQALADATQRPIEVAAITESTTLGAGYLAGLAVGVWSGWDEIQALWSPRSVVEPGSEPERTRWDEAVARASGWFEDLSALDF